MPSGKILKPQQPLHILRLTRVWLVGMCLMLTAMAGYAQDEYYIWGVVKDSDTFKKLADVEVTVIKGNSEFDHMNAGSSGKFEFSLPLGQDYTIVFTKAGYVSKKIYLETSKIPEEDRHGGFESNIDMTLFQMVDGFDTSILDKPIGRASFDVIGNSMVFDVPYTEQVQREIQAEFDRLEKMAGDMEKMRADFEKLVKEGDTAVTGTKYDVAIEKYSAALKLFPDDAPVQKKLADAQAAWDALQAANKKEQDYQRLIASGQNNMSAERWEDAKADFSDALKIKPGEKLPKDKLAEIDDILKNAAKREEYKALIADADTKFRNKDYAVSIEKYQAALALFPKEQYPRDQIDLAQAEIDKMLDEEKRKAELEQKYKDLITLADRNFTNKLYEDARRSYVEASGLKPEESHPKARIDEIDRILEELARQAEKDRVKADADAEQARIDKEYQDLIDAGNEYFAADDLESAREKYQGASEVKPAERYPKNKIDEIDRLIKQREQEALASAADAEKNAEKERIDREYQSLIDEANELFDADKLTDARSKYEAASAVKPIEKYPRSRIARIDEMLAERERLAREEELNAKRDKDEADRLAEERRRMDEEARAEEERLRKLEEEKAEQARLADEARLEKEADEARKRSLLSNIDSSREDDVEKYYREAKDSEQAAKYKSIRDQKERQDEFLAEKAEHSEDSREDRLKETDEKKDQMEVIFRDGQDLQNDRKRFKQKEIEEWESDEVERNENFAFRRLENQERAEMKKEQLAEVVEKDVIRQGQLEKVEDRKEDVQLQQQSFEKTGRALTAEEEYHVEMKKMGEQEARLTGMEKQQGSYEAIEERKEEVKSFQEDMRESSMERQEVSRERKELQKTEHENFGYGKEEGTKENEESIGLKKESVESFYDRKVRESQINRSANRVERFTKDAGSPKNPDDYKLPEGSEDLEEGVNETSYELPGKTVIERTVKIGNKVDVYRKVVSKTGTYYFKNNKSISESTWRRETGNITD